MAILQKAEETSIDPKLKYRVSVLRKSCQTITSNYPGGLINKKEIKQINKIVEYLIEKTFHIGAMETISEVSKAIISFSMILTFIDEIDKNSNNKWHKDSFNIISKQVVWLFEYLDPRYSYYKCYANGERLYKEINNIYFS